MPERRLAGGRRLGGVPGEQRRGAGNPGSEQEPGADFRLRLRRLSQVAARPRQVRGRAFRGRRLPARALYVEQQSAAALANYLRAQDSGPAGSRAKRAAKGDQPKPNEQKKAAPKPAEAKLTSKGAERKPTAVATPSRADGGPPDIMAPERRAVEPRPNPPAAERRQASRRRRQSSQSGAGAVAQASSVFFFLLPLASLGRCLVSIRFRFVSGGGPPRSLFPARTSPRQPRQQRRPLLRLRCVPRSRLRRAQSVRPRRRCARR